MKHSKRDKELNEANKVFMRIFDRAVPMSKVDIDSILDGCSSGQHKPHPDGICRGCGRHIALLGK